MNQGMSLRKNSIYTIIAVALALASCNRPTIYSHYESINTNGWIRSDKAEFDIISQEDGNYFQTLGLRATNNYPFTNLTLIVDQQVFPDATHSSDTINIQMTNQEGNFLGKGLRHLQYDIPLPSITLKKGDSVHISISHYMKREVLPGITDIGISLKKQTNN